MLVPGAARVIALRSVWQNPSLSWLPVSVRMVPPRLRNGVNTVCQWRIVSRRASARATSLNKSPATMSTSARCDSQ